MRIRYTAEADRDLDDLWDYLFERSPDAAVEMSDRLLQRINLLAAGELSGPEVRLKSGRLARRWSVTPYRIYYRIQGGALNVLRVYHQARRPIER